MALPTRSEIKEDLLPLQRALNALEDARKSLKQFGATASVENDAGLSALVSDLRQKVKRAKRRAKEIEKQWTDAAVY